MVNIDIQADFKDVERMLTKYKTRAVTEYKEAVRKTVIHGRRLAPQETPIGKRGDGTLKKSWQHEITGLSGVIFNTKDYAPLVNDGWNRTRPIFPVKAKILVFPTAKWTRSKKPSTMALINAHKQAMASLKGKGLSPQEKGKQATAKSGVVVTNKVTSPASFKGYKFMDKIFPKVEDRFMREIMQANERLTA